jgi:hypothetical protein
LHSINCEGPPREIGHTIGKSFRAEIFRTLDGHDGLNTRFMPYSRTPVGRARYQHLVALHRNRYPEFFSELEGMAEGAAVPFEKLFVINLRGDYQCFASGDGTFRSRGKKTHYLRRKYKGSRRETETFGRTIT